MINFLCVFKWDVIDIKKYKDVSTYLLSQSRYLDIVSQKTLSRSNVWITFAEGFSMRV